MNTLQKDQKQGRWPSTTLKAEKTLYTQQPSADQARKGAVFMPIKLRTILLSNGISQGRLAAAILQAPKGNKEGKPLSSSATSLLLTWGVFPKATPEASVKAQAEQFLKDNGIADDVIATIWDEELNNEMRQSGLNPAKPRSLDGKGKAGFKDASFLTEVTTPEATMLTQEALRHFKLTKNPFKNDIQGIDDVFMSIEHREILLAMHQAAKFGGLIAVIGESGAGKSVMRNALLDKIDKDEDSKIIVIQPQIIDKKKSSANSLLEAIIRDIDSNAKIPVNSEAKSRMARKLLIASAKAGYKHVLIQEEAHKHDGSIFPFYKQIWEIENGFNKLLGIILIGQPELKYHLSLQHNWDSREFINRCEVAELMPLDSSLEQYLKFKFERIGADVSQVLDADAYDCLREVMFIQSTRAKVSILHPLFVNNRIVQTMNLCAEIGMPLVNADAIKKAKL